MESMEILPRAEPKELKGLKRVKTPWDFMNSVFAKYRPDNEKMLNSCFLDDWEKCRIDKILKNDVAGINDCKEFLRRNYKVVRDVYKFYSGESIQGRLPCIGST